MPEALALLEQYRYLILIPLAIVEGPIVIIIAGFLVSLGYFDPFLVYVIGLTGDQIGDACLYAFGRWGGKFLHSHGSWIGVTPKRLAQAKDYFRERHLKAVTISKLVHGIGVAGLVAAGALHVPFKRYIRTALFISVIQDAAFLFIGMFFGHAYIRIGQYLDYYAAAGSVIVLAAIAFAIFWKIKKRSKS